MRAARSLSIFIEATDVVVKVVGEHQSVLLDEVFKGLVALFGHLVAVLETDPADERIEPRSGLHHRCAHLPGLDIRDLCVG